MRAGRLNRRISIRLPGSTSRSTDGQPIVTWSTVFGPVYADRQPISGRELFTQDQRWSEVTTRFITRYSTAVNSRCRVIDLDDSSAEYDIKHVIDINDQQRGLEILAVRVT